MFLLPLLSFGMLSCVNQPDSIPQEEYVSQAIDSLEHYSLYQSTYNFDSLEKALLLTVSDSTSQEALHNILEKAIHSIDKHSYVLRKEKWVQMLEGENPEVLNNPFPFQGKLINGKYAFVSLYGFSGGDSIAADNYCDSLQNMLSNLYQQKPAGWIIDLRYNNGGWAPAMFAGLGPILGRGVKAYTLFPNGSSQEYYYAKSDADYLLLSDSVWTFDETLPAAVLIGGRTGSAGELLALAFRGNSKTRLIGEPTYGVSTDITPILMPDSFQFNIASGIMTDRNKTGNGGPIHPEIVSVDTENTFEESYKWIDNNKK